MPVFPWSKKEGGSEHELQISMSDDDKKKLDAAVAASAELPEIKKRLEGLDSIQAFINEQRTERDEAKKAEAAKKAAAATATSDEQLDELMLTNPKEAIRLATQPQQQLLLQLRADNLRRETFENADKFKYYSGDIKNEVDKLIANQSLQYQNDPSVIENAYLTVIGKHHDEIMEGKIKSRFAGSSSDSRGTSSGSAGSSGAGGGKDRGVIPDDVAKIAKQFGMKPEEYADMLDKEGIGYA